jgi:hypothetical protein
MRVIFGPLLDGSTIVSLGGARVVFNCVNPTYRAIGRNQPNNFAIAFANVTSGYPSAYLSPSSPDEWPREGVMNCLKYYVFGVLPSPTFYLSTIPK